MPPFFTIITATRNVVGNLPRLLDSLAAQSCQDFELLVQDGASTDGTAALAKSWGGRLPALSIASAPDSGIYDAWNKALERANGEWILFLGADDRLADTEALAQVKETLAAGPPELMFAAGAVEMELPDGRTGLTIRPEMRNVRELLRRRVPAPPPALFHRRALFAAERFDANFRIAGDYEFLCRTWQDDSLGLPLNMVLTRMGWGGVSSSPQTVLAMRLEEARAAARHFERIWTPWRLKSLAGGVVIAALCRLVGPVRAGAVLDRLRVARGLSPCWGSGIRRE